MRRLYQQVADRLRRRIEDEFNVSRPTTSEAMTARDLTGHVEAKVGSGMYATNDNGGRNVQAAHDAMASHLTRVIDALLEVTETDAIERARQEAQSRRARYIRKPA
jgi:DNA-binding FadR family transcriptional regulator